MKDKTVQLDLTQALEGLRKLYELVDRHVEQLTAVHAHRLQCRLGCNTCCVDDVSVFVVEAENIHRHYHDMLEEQRPHEPGACAFLDEQGGCRIYDHRPYVCRTQGLPLRWMDERPDGTEMEMRDICPMNEGPEPIELLPDEQCWPIGPMEEALANLQAQLDGNQLQRVPLRSLFQLQP
jgi:Fe-S-cluster containining protein